jgi:hypothetical protein
VVVQCWHRQLHALFSPLCYKVLLAHQNVLAHTWSVDAVQVIIGSSSLVFEPAPTLVLKVDRSCFYVVAWTVHPELIPVEVGGVLLESEEPFVEGEPPLFLRASEIIHSRGTHYNIGCLSTSWRFMTSLRRPTRTMTTFRV